VAEFISDSVNPRLPALQKLHELQNHFFRLAERHDRLAAHLLKKVTEDACAGNPYSITKKTTMGKRFFITLKIYS